MQHALSSFTGEKYAEHFSYWKDQVDTVLKTPYAFRGNSPVSGSHRLSHLPLRKSFQFTHDAGLIRKYAFGADLESFILLLSGFYILFHKYRDEGNIVIETPLHKNNLRKQLVLNTDQHLPGACNTPFGCALEDDMTIRDVIGKVNQLLVSGYKYQDFSFSVLPGINELPEIPVFSNVLISYADLHLSPDSQYLEKYDLVMEIAYEKDPGRFVIDVTGNPAVFSDWFLDNLFAHYQQVIHAFEKPDSLLKDVTVFSPAEWERMTGQFNASRFDFPRQLTVVDVFEQQSDKTPAHTALIYKDKRLTYRQLNEQSNILAHALIAQYEITPGSRIAVLMDKSEYAIIGLLAILKAGAIYVPIDPKSPRERMLYQLQDAGVGFLLTHSDYMFDLGDFTGKLLALDIQLESLNRHFVNPERRSGPSDIAYIIYTSGSSGKPKGVLIEHLGLLNVSLHHIHELRMKDDDVYLQFMSLAFDGSLLDIFTALLSGAALLLPDKTTIDNTVLFLEYIAANRASVLTLTPSYLNALERNVMPGVRTLISAGEAARAEDARFYGAFKDFYNAYGPSEVTVNASLFKFEGALESAAVPIGKPGANKNIYILNDKLELAPVGIGGEICISGDGLARGYLNDELLTAEKFIPHPFIKGQRMYRSGDLGRWLPDGNIEYIGRRDEQVKLNGFRVDLGEIENSLRHHEHIKHATVVRNKPEDGGEKLIAFYQTRQRIEIVPSLGEYFIYDPFLYDSMAKDKMRVEGYKAALKDIVKDKVVLDPGTGRDMILARHCLEAGARKVYAVEMDEEAYCEAQDNLIRYNLKDEIILLKGDVTTIRLPEKIDYIVSALAGNISSSDGCIPIMNRIKDNLAYTPGFIPSRYVTRIAAASLPSGSYEPGISEISAHYISKVFDRLGYGFDLRLCLRYFSKDQLISDDAICERIDYAGQLLPEEVSGVHLHIHSDSLLHGFVLWINAFSGQDKMMIDSISPTHHLPVYFPVSEEGIQVEAGDNIQMTFERKLSDNGLNPDYFIDGVISGRNRSIAFHYSSYNHRKGFRPAAFYATIFDEAGKPRITPAAGAAGFSKFLRDRLPEYMIPTAFVKVPDFPVNAIGKIDKELLLQEYKTGEKIVVIKDPPRNDMEKLLLNIFRNVLGRQDIGVNDDFFKIGGDSIKAIQIASRMHREGYKMEVRHLFATPVIADLAIAIKPLSKFADQGQVTGVVGLTPIQKELFPPGIVDPHHYNQSVMFYTKEHMNAKVLEAVFSKLCAHHDILRATFRIIDGQWLQYNQEVFPSFSIQEWDLTADRNPIFSLEREAGLMQTGIDLGNGPLIKAGLFHLPDGHRLLIVIHHLVVDTVSWRILFEDIEELLQQTRTGTTLALPLKTLSFRDWSEKLYAYANSPGFLREKKYWQELESVIVSPLLKDLPPGPMDGTETCEETETLEISMTEAETASLQSLGQTVLNATLNDLLLTAIGIAVKMWTGNDKILLALEGHGREDILDNADTSRTVGWFTSMYPVILDVGQERGLLQGIRKIKDYLAAIPHKGIGHGILKHITNEEHKQDMTFRLAPQISFNYLGQFDADLDKLTLRIAKESVGKMKSPRHRRLHDLEIKGLVAGHRLNLSVTYDRSDFKQETIMTFINNCRSVLREMINIGKETKTSPDITGFEYKELSVEDLESLFD